MAPRNNVQPAIDAYLTVHRDIISLEDNLLPRRFDLTELVQRCRETQLFASFCYDGPGRHIQSNLKKRKERRIRKRGRKEGEGREEGRRGRKRGRKEGGGGREEGRRGRKRGRKKEEKHAHLQSAASVINGVDPQGDLVLRLARRQGTDPQLDLRFLWL